MKCYTRQGLWPLFLICAFPLHVWTLILAFGDISWVAERTNMWDAIGVVAYGLLFAFGESLVVWAAVAVLGLLISRKWEESRRIAVLSILVLVVSVWAMLGSLYFMLGVELPPGLLRLLAESGRPLRMLYVLTFGLVTPTVILPVYFILWSDRFFGMVQSLFERLRLLMMLYLLLDVAGLVIVIVRNTSL